MAKTDKGKVMTYGYDLECVIVALDAVENAARNFIRGRNVEDWLLHRLSHIRAEAKSLKIEIEKHKGESWEKFI